MQRRTEETWNSRTPRSFSRRALNTSTPSRIVVILTRLRSTRSRFTSFSSPRLNCGPEFAATGFMRAPDPLSQDHYIKRPSLLHCDDTEVSSSPGTISTLLLQEAQICEILAKSPHPNIAKYLGCVVEHDRITDLCFQKYGPDLSQRVQDNGGHALVDKESCLQSIRLGIDHLHTLGIIHCDINPSSILSDGDGFVIADFDSCAWEGEELGFKAGTQGWTRDDFKVAKPEMDFYGLDRIREFLYSSSVKNGS